MRNLDSAIEFPRSRLGTEGTARSLTGPKYLDAQHARDHQTQRILRDAGAQGIIARLRVGVEADLEARLLPAARLRAGLEVVDLAVLAQHLGLLALVHEEVAVGGEQREPRAPRHLVVLQRERPEGAPPGLDLGYRPAAARARAEAFARRRLGVLGPELEAAFDAEGSEEIGGDGGREPLELYRYKVALATSSGLQLYLFPFTSGWFWVGGMYL